MTVRDEGTMERITQMERDEKAVISQVNKIEHHKFTALLAFCNISNRIKYFGIPAHKLLPQVLKIGDF